jgi:hypothetical protein
LLPHLCCTNKEYSFSKLLIFNIMKKVAFTLGLAFFALGLFAQSTGSTAKSLPTSTSSTVKKEPMKAAPAQHAQAQPTASAGTAKAAPATGTTHANHQTATTAKTTTATGTKETPKKKHGARHHKKPATPATGTPKNAAAPKQK